MPIISTIIPIFLVILLGWIIHRRGFLPTAFMEPANRLVYFITIPPMIFLAITKSGAHDGISPGVILLSLSALLVIYLAAWGISRMILDDPSLSGSFIQCAGHGNLGYIGLAVAYYHLGNAGLAQASIIAGFIMILQNILSVMALQYYAPDEYQSPGAGVYFKRLATNPIIISVVVGLIVSTAQLPVPVIVQRTFSILSGLALPAALLIIGASLSLEQIQRFTTPALWVSALKLLALPGAGWILFRIAHINPSTALPGLILLAAPSATVSYVMAREMHGSPDLAAATISASTTLSAGTLMLWLWLGNLA